MKIKDNKIHEFFLFKNDNTFIERRDRTGSCNIPDFIYICVYNENNEPPHFHLVFNKNFDTDNSCFKIIDNVEYPHGKHKVLLNTTQIKNLNKELSKNNFEIWNKNNPNNKVDINLKFKDY